VSDPTPTPGWTPRTYTREDLAAASDAELRCVREALEQEQRAVRWLREVLANDVLTRDLRDPVGPERAWWQTHLGWREHEVGTNVILTMGEETRRRLAKAAEVRA
jgi:hypothetical protein